MIDTGKLRSLVKWEEDEVSDELAALVREVADEIDTYCDVVAAAVAIVGAELAAMAEEIRSWGDTDR